MIKIFRKNKKTKKDESNEEWVNVLKRRSKTKTVSEQPSFEFRDNLKNIDTEAQADILGTKNVPSYKVADISAEQIKILKNCKSESTLLELMKILKRSNRTRFRNDILTLLLKTNFLEATIPEKPKSPKQKYRLTGKFIKRLV